VSYLSIIRSLAKELGAGPEAAREVAQAMARNPVALIIPCHRVLAAGGKVGGFFGPGGYRDLAAGGPATLEFARRRLPVQAIPANDAASVARASAEFLRKYQPSSHAHEMVRSEVLPTTLRLESR
jgi:O-6-methylguanine DNA methyltransferase